MNKRALIFFLKYPEKGRVKTRLAQTLGDDFVLELYRCFISDILETCREVDSDTIIAYSLSNGEEPNSIISNDLFFFSQKGDNLGERMYNAFMDVSKLGYNKLVLIGSDCPDLPADVITEAFENLESVDIVLGPSNDGGYYLIGLRAEKIDYAIFKGVPWSTPYVLAETQDNLKGIRISLKLLKVWSDIDDAEDLRNYYNRYKNNDARSSTMSFLSKTEALFNY